MSEIKENNFTSNFITRDMVYVDDTCTFEHPKAKLGDKTCKYFGTVEADPKRQDRFWLAMVENNPDKIIDGIAVDYKKSRKQQQVVLLPDSLGKWWIEAENREDDVKRREEMLEGAIGRVKRTNTLTQMSERLKEQEERMKK